MSATESNLSLHASVLELWTDHVEHRYVDPTKSLYRATVLRWLQWLEARSLRLTEARADHVAAFCLDTHSKSTAASRLSVIRRLCALAMEHSLLRDDPTEGLTPTPQRESQSSASKTVTTGPAPSSTPWVRERNALAHALRCKLGLSPHQIGVLRLTDVRADTRTLQPPPARRRSEAPEAVEIPEEIVRMLQRWLATRRTVVQMVLLGDDPGTLLVGQSGAMNRQSLWKSMRRKRRSHRRTTRDAAA